MPSLQAPDGGSSLPCPPSRLPATVQVFPALVPGFLSHQAPDDGPSPSCPRSRFPRAPGSPRRFNLQAFALGSTRRSTSPCPRSRLLTTVHVSMPLLQAPHTVQVSIPSLQASHDGPNPRTLAPSRLPTTVQVLHALAPGSPPHDGPSQRALAPGSP